MTWAECTLNEVGDHEVSLEIIDANRVISKDVALFHVVATPLEQFRVQEIIPIVPEFQLSEDASNDATMQYFGGDSIATIGRHASQLDRNDRAIAGGPLRYGTTPGRTVSFEVTTLPPGLEALIEVRSERRHPFLAYSGSITLDAEGQHLFQIGPPARQRAIQVETYHVEITNRADLETIPEGVPVTFEAVTNPPGYEHNITWLSSTKYGTATPVMGRGPTFTVQFDDTFGPDDGIQWLGVKADDARLGQDQAQTGACCMVGNCQNAITQATCSAQSGIYRGNGSTCPPTAGPAGACCFAMLGCAQRTQENCSCQGGYYLGNGVACPANDPDTDCIGSATDNCDNKYNPLQEDLDLDGIGDVCDNCVTQPNPGQEDANGDMGGDACEPSQVFASCGKPMTPEPGIAPELLDPKYPHPDLNGVIHPVVQMSASLMDGQLEALVDSPPRVQILSAFDHVNFLVALEQEDLQRVAALPFVRAIYPLPMECRTGAVSNCVGLQSNAWAQSNAMPAPTARARAAIAFDSVRNRAVLFGGQDSSGGALADTWEWNGSAWAQIIPGGSSPSGRRDHAMAFDKARNRTVLFGGLAGLGVLNDTWEWNGTNWTQRAPANSPSVRHGHAMAYDELRGHIILFGGMFVTGQKLSDTWRWDGTNWTQLAPANSPSARLEHAMAYDAVRQVIVLFGGDDAGIVNDTWEWNGSNWTLRNPITSPSARFAHALVAIDPDCGVFLLGGKNAGGSALEDQWSWNGEVWTEVQAMVRPAARHDHAMTWDSSRRRAILHGGSLGFRVCAGGPEAGQPCTTDAECPGSTCVDVVSGETWEAEPSHLMDVILHGDVQNAAANSIFAAHNSIVIQPGVTVSGTGRVNIWRVQVPDSQRDSLVAEEPVLNAEFAGRGEPDNNGIRTAIGVAPISPPLMGTGIVLAQWDVGWAAGDATAPALPAGGAHAALTGNVTVRDRPPLAALAGPAEPAGCVGVVVCNSAATTGNFCMHGEHATHVCGTMLGDGTGNLAMRGMAPASTNITYGLPETAAEAVCELTDSNVNFGARLANNSWGLAPVPANMALYGAFSNSYDQRIRMAPAQTVMFSASNFQTYRAATAVLPAIFTSPVCTPLPAGVTPLPGIPVPLPDVLRRFFSLRPQGGQAAKNTLVVGAVDSGSPSAAANLGRMTTFSSWGPTQDGRIKPDVVSAGSENCPADPLITSTFCGAATGCGAPCTSVVGAPYGACAGTSMSTPAVTGASALLLEHQAVIGGPIAPDTALDSDSLKALLIHTATDLSVHLGPGGAFMALAAGCWPVPPVVPGAVADGPDYVNGWGLVNYVAARNKITAGNPAMTLRPSGCPAGVTFTPFPFNSPLAVGGNPAGLGLLGCPAAIWDWVAYLTVPAGTTQLKVTVVWNDVEATPPPGSVLDLLINDLDLVVTQVTGIGGGLIGNSYYSSRLDPACPYLQAVPVVVPSFNPALYADHLNNVEQVVVTFSPPLAAAQTWRIVVQGIGLSPVAPSQPFGIVVSIPPSVP